MKHSLRSLFSLGVVVILTAFLFTTLHQPGAWSSFPLSLVPLPWRSPLILELLQALIVALATYLIVRWDMMVPLLRVSNWMKTLRLGSHEEPPPPTKGVFEPLAKEVTYMAKSLSEARAAAEEEARLRQAGESLWTPERLKELVRQKLPGRTLLVISNREPYQHIRQGSQIISVVPPQRSCYSVGAHSTSLRRYLDRASDRQRRPGSCRRQESRAGTAARTGLHPASRLDFTRRRKGLLFWVCE